MFIRLEKPIRASQISQCYGAGTGCGWCRPYLEKLLAESNSASESQAASQQQSAPLDVPAIPFEDLSPEAYADLRKNYVEEGHGTPPE